MFGGESEGRADDAEVLSGEHFAFFDVLAGVDGAAEMGLFGVLFAAGDGGRAEGGVGATALSDEFGEFLGLEGEGGVDGSGGS